MRILERLYNRLNMYGSDIHFLKRKLRQLSTQSWDSYHRVITMISFMILYVAAEFGMTEKAQKFSNIKRELARRLGTD